LLWHCFSLYFLENPILLVINRVLLHWLAMHLSLLVNLQA
jgi:hypothetical protein